MNEHLLAADRLFSGYDKQTILHDISISVPQNKISVILGANGCGKSTLFNLMTKNLKPDQGEVFSERGKYRKFAFKRFCQRSGDCPSIQYGAAGSYGRKACKLWANALSHHGAFFGSTKDEEKYSGRWKSPIQASTRINR